MKADPNATAPNAMTKYATQIDPTRLRTRFDGTSMTVNYRMHQTHGLIPLSEKMTYKNIEHCQRNVEVESFHAEVGFET